MPRVGPESRAQRQHDLHFRFLVQLERLAPKVVRDLRDTALPSYRKAVADNPNLYWQPIFSWPLAERINGRLSVGPAGIARGRLSVWASRHGLTFRDPRTSQAEGPRWLLEVARGALEVWHKQGSWNAEHVPMPIWYALVPAILQTPSHLLPPGPLDTLDRHLVWFIRRHVQKRKWAAIRKEFGIDFDQETTIRNAVARIALRLGFTLRRGVPGKPSPSQ